MVTSADISRAIDQYLEKNPSSRDYLVPLLKLIDSGADVTSRTEFRGHVTAGAIVLRDSGDILLIRHRSLAKWLHPGGHLEQQDDSLRGAAIREFGEELGVEAHMLGETDEFGRLPLDIDRHPIPENPAKGEPKHDHWDFRFVFRLLTEKLTLQLSEVTDAQWVSPAMHSEKIASLLEHR